MFYSTRRNYPYSPYPQRDQGAPWAMPSFPFGERLVSQAGANVGGYSSSHAGGLLQATVFWVPRPTYLTAIGLYGQAATGTTLSVRFGLYADSGDGFPQCRLLDSGEYVVNTTLEPKIWSPAAPYYLAPGMYWVALGVGTGNFGQVYVDEAADYGLRLLGATNHWAHEVNRGFGKAWTYDALPDPFPADATGDNIHILVMVRL